MGRAMSLRLQLLSLQAAIVCAIVVATGLLAGWQQERILRDGYLDRMIGVAQSVANLPTVIDAFDQERPSEVIQPIAEVIREASDVTYVVVTDIRGVRLSHPDPSRVGEMVSTDPSVPLSGKTFVGTQTGTLGESWRAKVPVFDTDGVVIGSVSVGILESALQEDLHGGLGWLVLALCGAAVLGIFGAGAVTGIIRRRIFGLEPHEIASLVGSQETMLHGMSEGIVTVDDAGQIVLANDAAIELLGLDWPDSARAAADGRHVQVDPRPFARDVLDPSLIEVLESGEPDGRLVLSGERVIVARSTGSRVDGKTVGATLLIRDHTELHNLLRAMDGAQSLTDGLRAQAHEFANSMHVVAGLLDLGRPDEARRFILRLGSGGPLDSGESAHESALGLPELAALLMVKRSQARELGITLSFTAGQETEDLRATMTDAAGDDVVTIVGNLVDNALEACGAAGHRVDVRVHADDTHLVVSVEDDGAGIPLDQYDRVFEAGVSSKAVLAPSADRVHLRRRGLGLALVRRVVERNAGTVEVGESPSGGARFTVRLPIALIAFTEEGDPALTEGAAR